jgi:hypothetical protein
MAGTPAHRDRLRIPPGFDSAAGQNFHGSDAMKKVLLIAAATATALSLSACSKKAQNEANEAAEAMAADVNVTMGEAVNDIDAASDKAFGAAENTMDTASNATGEKLKQLGNDIEE